MKMRAEGQAALPATGSPLATLNLFPIALKSRRRQPITPASGGTGSTA